MKIGRVGNKLCLAIRKIIYTIRRWQGETWGDPS